MLIKTEVECPVGRSLDIIGGKWNLRIIHQVGNDVKRYGDIRRGIPEISEKMLIQVLKNLVEHDILFKHAFHEIPPRVEYSLTERGKKLLPIIDHLKAFGESL